MRRFLLIYGSLLLFSFLGFAVFHTGNQPTFENSESLGAVFSVERRNDTNLLEEEGQKRENGLIKETQDAKTNRIDTHADTYSVVKVVDGDTLDVSIDGKIERLRLIGIDTPETVDPRKPVQCFGIEASNKAKAILTGKEVGIESDPTQGERDKYGRLLRYVFLPDGTNFNLLLIKEGYAHEYTYAVPYRYQVEFKSAQKEAMENKSGLWGAKCEGITTGASSTAQLETSASTVPPGTCTIKGNISTQQEKIYHVIGCGSYDKTIIDENAGEKWFCSEQDALDAGWRKAKNC